MEITRDQLVRILGEEKVKQAETMPDEEFQQQKWDHLPELLNAYEKVYHTNLFEARRSFLLGLPVHLQILLVRHIFDEKEMKTV